jgi:NAD(P)-dependent dehydrogenase (short-subunit alcohol dehydrogenase family)
VADIGRLDGRIGLVTGGSRGVGRAIVTRLAALGADVAFSYRRRQDAADALIKELAPLGGRYVAFGADLAVPGAARQLVQQAGDELGAPTILANNAGAASRGRTVEHTGQDEYLSLYQVHVVAAAEACAAVLPGMRQAGGGSIVFISSVAARGLGPGLDR